MKRTNPYWIREGYIDDPKATWHYATDGDDDPLPIPKRAGRQMIGTYCGRPVLSFGWVRDNDNGGEWIKAHRARICLDCLDVLAKEKK